MDKFNDKWSELIYNYYRKDVIDCAEAYIDMSGWTPQDKDYDDLYDDMFVSDEVCHNGSWNTDQVEYPEFAAMAVYCGWFKDICDDCAIESAHRILGCGDEGLLFVDAAIRCWMLGVYSAEIEKYYDGLNGVEV